MVSILFWVSLYFLAVTHMLLFFNCASYNENPCVVTYHNELPNFYCDLLERKTSQGGRVSKLFFSNTLIGSCYRHSLVKEYITNTSKLKSLEFSEEEIKSINELLVPGFEERDIIFTMLKVILFFLTIISGIVVGVLI